MWGTNGTLWRALIVLIAIQENRRNEKQEGHKHKNPSTSFALCLRRCWSGSSLFERLYEQNKIHGLRWCSFTSEQTRCACWLPGRCGATLLALLLHVSVSPVSPAAPGTLAESVCHWSDCSASHPQCRKHTHSVRLQPDTQFWSQQSIIPKVTRPRGNLKAFPQHVTSPDVTFNYRITARKAAWTTGNTQH